MTQGYNNLINILNNMPGQQDIGRAVSKYLPMVTGDTSISRIYDVPGYQSGINYEVQPQPRPSKFNIGDGKQIGYKLPDGTYTSNKNLVDIAKQQMAKANRMALAKTAGKGLGLLSTAIPFYKDIALPVANDLYQGFILGNPNKSKTLQSALNLAGIDINGNVRPRVNKNSTKSEPVDKSSKTGKPSDMIITGSNSTGITPTVSDTAEVVTPEQQANSQAVIDYINKLQQINQPYINSLQNYLNNYDKLARENYARNRYWQGIASITGNPAWSKMADYYNPVTREATKVGLVKQLQDAQSGDLNAINEVMGNMEIANQMELPPETAFANKNLLSALMQNKRILTDWDKAQLYDATKRYGFDSALNRALAVQNLRNQGALERALINASIYGGGFPGVAPGLNAQSGVNTQKEIQLQQAFNGSR